MPYLKCTYICVQLNVVKHEDPAIMICGCDHVLLHAYNVKYRIAHHDRVKYGYKYEYKLDFSQGQVRIALPVD